MGAYTISGMLFATVRRQRLLTSFLRSFDSGQLDPNAENEPFNDAVLEFMAGIDGVKDVISRYAHCSTTP
jgi:hypothetical protein